MNRLFGGVILFAYLSEDAKSQAPVAVTLLSITSPTAGEPGVTNISVTGSNFPTGTILPASVMVTLKPGGGPLVTTPATAVATVAGTTRRVNFMIPVSVSVSTPTSYAVTIGGTTSTGITFQSSNSSSLTVNPVASLVTIAPSGGQPGESSLSVAITGRFSNFLQGSTVASFGTGITVNSTKITDATDATVSIAISANAIVGQRTVTMTTGIEVATLTNGFNVREPGGTPTISDFNPKSGSIGTLVTINGSNLLPNVGTSAQVTLAKQGGGTMSLTASSATSTNITFVIPAGAATAPLAITVNGGTASSVVPLTIVASSGFSLTATPASANLIGGQNVSYAVQLNGTNGFNQLTQLSLSGLPSGVTATFSPVHITAGQTSILKVTAPSSQIPSISNLSISATTTVDGLPVVQSASISLAVVAPTTTLLGRTVATDATETPLAGVTVKTLALDGNGNTTGCAGHTTISDAAGNFSLTGLPLSCTGPQLIDFDGTTATSPQGSYAGVNLIFTLAQGQVTAAPVFVHLPRIDTAETFLVTQNASTDQSYSWKGIPGLSVTVYANTTFTMPDGTHPNPFPLAAVSVPVDRLPDAKAQVPTMVMVFIVAFQPANAFTNQPVAVSYPNTVYNAAGATSILMTLDPTHGVMVPYGTATVSNDATQFVPDPDPAHPGHRYGLVHFDWHMVGTPTGNQTNPCDCIPCPRCGHSVDLSTGLEVIEETDISYGGARGSISIVRTYRNGIDQAATTFGPFGYGTNHNWGYELDNVNPSTASVISLIMPDGNRFPFSKQANGWFVSSGVPRLGGGIMTVSGNAVDLRWKDGTTFHFIVILSAPLLRTLLDSVVDPNGNKFQITHNGFQIQAITDSTGRSLTFNYNVGGCITRIMAPDGTFVSYDYRGNGLCANAAQVNLVADLRQVTRTDGNITQYSYDVAHNLTSVTNQNGATFASLTYNTDARVAQEKLGDGRILKYAYMLQNPLASLLSPVLATTVTDGLGNQTVYRFNTNQGVIGVTDALGQNRTIDRDGGNFVVGMHGTGSCGVCGDPAAGDQTFSYDDSTGNLLSVTNASGNTTAYTYDPVFNKLISLRDPLGNLTTFTLDSHGNRLTQKDPNGNITSFAYDLFGELVSVTDALRQTTSFAYDTFGNVISVKDPLGNLTSFQYDANGRMLRTQDALGRITTLTYDGASRITSQTNARGGVTQFAYDELGDLTSVTDARNNKTTFTYDLMKQLLTRTDPLGRADQRSYDLGGNLIQFQDRRGQTSSFTYDVVNRLIAETYSDATVARSYDANSRLENVNDSAGGVFAFTYDPAGRLLSSASPLGEIQYAYDARGAVTSRQVVGQSAVTYSYDFAGNLGTAATPQASATFAYNPRNQLASLSRLNGVSSTFGYDNAARLLSITHAKGTAVIDVESYGYDAVGNRVSHSTSIGQSLITQATPSAAYDAANEQNQFGPTSNTFDASGSLLSSNTSSGNNTFAWDSRGRLKSITTSVGQVTSFTYDYAGNLIAQAESGPTLNLTKSFLLDDLTNIAYESASDGSSYSVLSGRSVDSHIGIVQSTEQVEYSLSDAINSTVETVDQSGTLKSQFLYEPYGLTTTVSSYPFQFTGRTPVSGSLYNYRARFYNASSGRFINEDPLGLGGGDINIYRYAENAPGQITDPSGLEGFLTTRAHEATELAYELAEQGQLWTAIGVEVGAVAIQAGLFTPYGAALDILTDPCKSGTQQAVGVALAIGLDEAATALGELKTAYRPFSGYGLDRSLMATFAFSANRVLRYYAFSYSILDALKTGFEFVSGPQKPGCGCSAQ